MTLNSDDMEKNDISNIKTVLDYILHPTLEVEDGFKYPDVVLHADWVYPRNYIKELWDSVVESDIVEIAHAVIDFYDIIGSENRNAMCQWIVDHHGTGGQ